MNYVICQSESTSIGFKKLGVRFVGVCVCLLFSFPTFRFNISSFFLFSFYSDTSNRKLSLAIDVSTELLSEENKKREANTLDD